MTEREKKNMIGKVFRAKGRPLDEEKIRNLAEIAQEADFPSGAVIQDIGLEQKYVYLIIEGIARSYYIDRDGSDITKMFMREYEFAVGESLFLTESLEVFETLEKLKSIRFEAKKLKEIILSDKTLLLFYTEMLEQTVIYKMRREYSLQNMQAMERYLQFREIYGDIEERVSQSVIASYIGIKKESLSRIRRTLKMKSKEPLREY